LKCFDEIINCNAHYTTDWSAESSMNGVVDGGVFMNMLPKDHAHVVQCHSIYMSYKIPLHIYVVFTHVCVVEQHVV